MRTNSRIQRGFTLIEVLMVIAIIGILIGLLVPAVGIALRSVRKNAIAMEVTTIASAIERYKEKYGDYPPDGSNAAVLSRHLRKVFPQIAASEISLLTAGSNASTGLTGAVMDPPEALVFFLGGFSDDPVHPFTGAGGPFAATPNNSTAPVQYNVDRNAPLFEFKQAQLTLEVMQDPGSGSPITVSNDETEFGLVTPPSFPGDLIPVYRPAGKRAPIVYFDSRTYTSGTQYNRYQVADLGAARPYLSDNVNTTSGTAVYRYAEDKTFQLISAGLDDSYGGVISSDPTDAVLYRFPSGESVPASATRYIEMAGQPSLQLDNATNFSQGVLEDSLEN